MNTPSDTFIRELVAIVDQYRHQAEADRDVKELVALAASSIDILTRIRSHQVRRTAAGR
ncbi:MAG: hypothetical protein AAGH87_08110 [Pseudomonadota bacterium]